MITIRLARPQDATEMSTILSEILMSKKSDRPSSPKHILAHYITHADNIACSVAINENIIVGFQTLKIASQGNPFDLPIGWGIIGTYVKLHLGKRGIGKALFTSTIQAAKAVGLATIDATIGANNTSGLIYYDAIGFQTYRTISGAIGKRFDVSSASSL